MVELDIFGGERGRDLLAGISFLEVAGDYDRLLAALGGELVRERLEPVRAPRRQRQTVSIRGEHPRQLRADARRGTGDQRYPLSHDRSLLN